MLKVSDMIHPSQDRNERDKRDPNAKLFRPGLVREYTNGLALHVIFRLAQLAESGPVSRLL
jgi:hypothetical protein